MIDCHLNLLPPQKKHKLLSLVKFLFIKENLELTLLTAALLGITHLTGWLVLTGALADLSHSATLVNREFSAYNQEIRAINQRVRAVLVSSRDFSPVTPLLLAVARSLPPDVKLTTLTVRPGEPLLVLAGVARSRAALLGYQQILASLPELKDVVVPTSFLLPLENLTFEIKAKLNKPLPPLAAPAP